VRTYYVYMLLCFDGTFYTGVTSNLEVRVAEHELGIDPESYTHSRRPLKLIYAESFGTPLAAIDAEKRIKGWSRAKKRALMRGDWPLVRELARNTAARLADTGGGPSTSSG
jgi:putative endonuclease